MTNEQYLKHLLPPKDKIDVVLDTDAFNEIDDQYALSWLLRAGDKLSVKALYAAPFFNDLSVSPEDGMEKSYDEILKLLKLLKREDMAERTFKGSGAYLPDEKTPVRSAAAEDLAARAAQYSSEKPLYVLAIGAITDVASAILINPAIAENIVVVFLGGHGLDYVDNREFNMMQDVSAARVVFGCGCPLVVLPCIPVISNLITTEPELRAWLSGKSAVADYLVENTVSAAEQYAKGKVWGRVIWDVSAVAWVLNGDEFFKYKQIPLIMPRYDDTYEQTASDRKITYVCFADRDKIFGAMFKALRD